MNIGYGLMILIALILALIMWLGGLADRRRPLPELPDGLAAEDRPAPAYASRPAVPEPVGGLSDGPAAASTPGELPPAPVMGYLAPGGAAAAPAPYEGGTLLAATAYALLIMVYLSLLSLGLLIQGLGALAGGPLGAQFSENLRATGNDPGLLGVLSQLGPTLWLPALLGMVLLLRPVRGLFARLVRTFDPRRTVHALALSYTTFVMINLFSTLVLLPTMTRMLEGANQPQTPLVTPSMVWIQEIYMAVLALIGVGWLSRRTIGQCLRRLALVVPTGRQALLGLGIGLLMVPVVVAIQFLAQALHIPMDTDVQRVSEALLGPLTQSALGILTIGLAAALGEEALFRGALQPRFGLVLTAILFALMHGNYGLSLSTLVVLILGFVLGIVRARTNTSTTMILHAVYNSTLGLLAFLNIVK